MVQKRREGDRSDASTVRRKCRGTLTSDEKCRSQKLNNCSREGPNSCMTRIWWSYSVPNQCIAGTPGAPLIA
uniref:Uncharacterized protein n=1 Tax=Ascaris lumbricoides TaxID=6252 RepID=A0A0M3IM84_ASCLU